MLICTVLCGLNLQSQVELTTAGDDFWFGFMNNYIPDSDITFTAFISSDEAASGTVEIPLLGWSQNFTTTVGTTTAIDIPLIANNNTSGVVSNTGVHLTSTGPVNLYVINHVANSADATRVLPKPFLDISYVVNAEEGQTNITDTLRSELVIVATEDGTEIEINPACDMLGGAMANVPFTIQMDQGQTYLLKASSLEDVSGTTINGTEASGDCRPFAVFGGSECAFVGENCSVCDHVFDHIVPSGLWGTEYFMGTFDTWISSYTYRVTAAENGTEVFVDGVSAFMLNAGETQQVNTNSEPIYLSASAPVRAVQYMESAGCTINGDPAMMTLNSIDQTLDQVTFTTIGSDLINNHHLQITVPTNAINSVFLDGIPIPPAEFTPYVGNNQFSFADIEVPEGSHQLECQQRFIANVYGLGNAESYLYSTGAAASEPLDPVPTVFCTENQVVLETAENYVNIWWSTLEDPETSIFTGQPFVIDPPIQNQIYILHGDNFLSGCPVEELFSVESPAPLDVNITEGALVTCLFEEYTFNPTVTPAGSGYEYAWLEAGAFSVSDEPNGVINPTESGMYYLEVSTFSGCAVGIDSVEVNVVGDDITMVQAVADPLAICEGETVELEVKTGINAGIDFFNGVIIDDQIWDDISGADLGDLCGALGSSSLFFNAGGTRFIESLDIDMTNGGAVSFSIQISDGSQGCDGAEFGEDVVLQYSTNGGANWTELFVLFEDQYPVFETVEVILPPEAETAATRFRWIQPVFSGINEDIWSLDNVVFSTFDTSASSFSWSSNAVIADPSAAITTSQPSEDTYYFIETSLGTCTYTDSVLVEVQPAFDLTITADTTICSPLPVPLSVSVSEPGFYSYQWNNEPLLNASNGANTIATPTAATTFEVEVSSPSGCSSTASVTVELHSSFAPFISPESSQVCSVPHPLEVILEGDPNDYTFLWTPADVLDNVTTQMVNASPAGGTFTPVEVEVTNTVTGCVNTAIQNLSANFAVFDLPRDTVICESEGFVIEYDITNSMFNAVQWNNTDVLDNAFTSFPTITAPDFNGDLIVDFFVPGFGGCSVSDTITIITQPLAYEAPDVISNCAGGNVQAAISGDFNSISWLSSDNLDMTMPSAPVFSNNEDETFYFDLNGGGGCVLSDSIEVIINLPTAFEITADGPLCEGGNILLDNPLSGMTYLWNNGAETEDLTVATAGNYSVVVTDSAGCSVTDDIMIDIIPNGSFDLLGNTTACAGESITLTADVASDNFLWSDGSMLPSATFSLAGTQTVWAEVIDGNNCVLRDSIDLLFRDPVALELTSSGAICNELGATLTATASNVDLLWETNETSASIEVFTPQFYAVTATDLFDCSATDSILVEEVVFPLAFSLDAFICEGNQVFIQPEVSAELNVSWSTGEDGDVLVVSQPGDYQLILSSQNCEKAYDFTIAEQDCPESYIYIPNSFTPDSDGLNEVWQVITSDLIDTYSVLIFDRDGHVVYKSNDPNAFWNGSVNGGDYYAPDGVYHYVINYGISAGSTGAFSEKIAGHITILR